MFHLVRHFFRSRAIVLSWGRLSPVLAGLGLFGGCTVGTAGIPDFSVHVWQTEEGLPQNSLTSVVQTRDGYLWIGTYSGLARFDGVRFTVFDDGNTPGLRGSRITSLFEDAGSTLWIGHETGELTRLTDGNFKPVEVKAAWNNRRQVLGIGADEIGDIWLINADGLLAQPKNGLMHSPRRGLAVNLVSMARNARGTMWIARDGAASVFESGLLKPLVMDRLPADSYVQGLSVSPDGGLWVANNGRLRKWRGRSLVEDLGTEPWGNNPVTALIETRSGLVAAGTQDHGMYLIEPHGETRHFSRTNGLPSDWVRSLCEDHEGNLWMGTGGGGLVALRPGNIATLTPPDQWQGRVVLSVHAAKDGTLWVGTEGAGLYRFRNGQWTHFNESDGLVNSFVWSVSEDATGRIWVGTWGGGLFVQQGDKFQRPAGLEEIMAPTPALLHAKDGSLWVGTGSGLLHFSEGRQTWFGEKEGLAFPDVRCMAEGPDGTLWFGMSGGGLGCLKNGALRQFRKGDGPSSDFIRCLLFDNDGTLWIATAGGGLNRLKQDRFSIINTKQGLPKSILCGIEDDGRGNFWISAQGGILRVAKEELNRCADGKIEAVRCTLFGKEDGMPTIECSGGMQPATARSADGRLWFPTSMGLVVADPVHVRTNALPPPVVIEEMRANGRLISVRGNDVAPRRIPPGEQHIEFDYTALSFVVPGKVRFKCRLDPLESEWMDAGTKRTMPYSYIPPGDYVFRVTACNNDDIWNSKGAALAFTVLPHFWQTWWFRTIASVAVVTGVAAGVWVGTRRRMRHKLERLERQRAVERERARIAKDIHDDLGASLTRISLLSESVPEDQISPPQAAEAMTQIFSTTHELVRAMDEIVWAVNPQHDTLDSLANYLSSYAQDYLETAGVRCRLDLPVQLPVWQLTAEVRHNLFLAFKEALNNVVKHAAASEVRISLALASHEFSITVEDDGRGFSPGAPKAEKGRISSGNGLANMRQRLEEIGGRSEIEGHIGRGTRVKFAVPLKPFQT